MELRKASQIVLDGFHHLDRIPIHLAVS